MNQVLLWKGPHPIAGLRPLKELREEAKAQGLKGYSKMGKGEITSMLELVLVWKGDSKAVRFLGQAFLRTCAVERWKKARSGNNRRWSPAAWFVPRFRLGALLPLSEEEVTALLPLWEEEVTALLEERPLPVRKPKIRGPRHRVVMDIVPDSRIRLFGNAPRRSCKRFASLFRTTWDSLPTKDRKKMLTYCRRVRGRNASTLLFVDYGPDLVLMPASSAVIFAKTCEIWVESRAMQTSTDARVKAIIAHELGHLRSFYDPGINLNDYDQLEREANGYAELWGFPCVDGVYKTRECDELEKFARHLDMRWRIFYVNGFFNECFTALSPGERIGTKCHDFIDIGGDSEEVRDEMRDFPLEYYGRRR
jgi:hypothetical protein